MAIGTTCRLLLLGGLVIASGGCATIVAPGPDMVPVSTQPPGAKVFLDGRLVLSGTPGEIWIERDEDGVIRIEEEGYEAVTVYRDKVLNGWFFPGNLLWLLFWPAFPVAMVVDLVEHNQGKHSSDPLYVTLRPVYRNGDTAPATGPPAASVRRPQP